MTRPLRIEYPGALYHVTNRGNEQRDIFRDDEDRTMFLEILRESISLYSIRLYSFVLMTNHFHLLLETPLGNLGEFMRRFNITYTGYFNRKYNRCGHLYQGRYKSLVVEKDAYLTVVSRYIHLNPVRIAVMREKTVKEQLDYLKKYRWSSLLEYIGGQESFVEYSVVLEEYGGTKQRGRLNYLKAIEEDMRGTLDIKKSVVGQSILGGEAFVEEVLGVFENRSKRDRERPALQALNSYCKKEKIIKAVESGTSKTIEEIRKEGGLYRQLAMELLCRLGGLKGREVGNTFGVDYSTVSVSRKRLRSKLEKDSNLRELFDRITKSCQR